MTHLKIACYLTAGQIEALVECADEELEQAAEYGELDNRGELRAGRDELARMGGPAVKASPFWTSSRTDPSS